MTSRATIFPTQGLARGRVCTAVVAAFAAAALANSREELEQTWRWSHYTTQDGLPSNLVLDICESSDGTVWVVTDRGLAWFDGFFWQAVGPDQGLPNASFRRVFPDAPNGVLVIADGRLFRGDRDGFEPLIIPAPEETSIEPLAAAASDGGLLLLLRKQNRNSGGCYRFDGRDLTPIPTEPAASLEDDWFVGEQQIWRRIASSVSRWGAGIWRRDSDRAGATQPARGDWGVIWVGYPNDEPGLWWWSVGQTPKKIRSWTHGLPRAVAAGPDGQVFIVESNGHVHIWRGKRWKRLEASMDRFAAATVAFYQRNGNLWVGTHDGVSMYRAVDPLWEHIHGSPGERPDRVHEIVCARDGRLWLATRNGLLIRKPTGELTRVTRAADVLLANVTGLAQDGEGNIWATSGFGFEGALRFDGQTWTHFGTRDGLPGFRHKVRIDRRGRPWFLSLGDAKEPSLLTGYGAALFDNGQFVHWTTAEGLIHERVYAFEEAPDGAYWFGTLGGLCRWKDGEWTYWTEREGLESSKVWTLAFDETGTLWFSDGRSGLGVLRDGEVNYLTTADGLPGNDVQDIRSDPLGGVWASFSAGVVHARADHRHVFYGSDGIGQSVIWPVLPMADRVYVGTIGDGLAILNRDALRDCPLRVSIEEPGLHGRAATLRWRVASLDGVIRPKNIETRWRTDGGGWSPWSTERRAVVADVSPGAHRLTVQARNRLADAPVVRQEITFELPLPLHRQPLFLASTFGGVGGILILLAVMSARRRRHAAALRRHQELLDAIVADATDAIAVTDVEGHYLYVNPAASRWLGLPAEDLIGRCEYDVVPPDCAERIRADDRRLLSRCSQDDQPHRFENTIERDGKTVTYAVSKSVLRDDQGRPTAIVGIAHDVTEQRRVEEILRRGQRELEELVQQRTKELAAANESLRAEIAERARIELTLRESEQRLSDALDATSDGVWDWRIPEDKSIRSDLWYKLTGYERGELEAYEAKHGSIIHPDDEPRMRALLQKHLDGQTATYRAEFRIRHKSGELRWILGRGRVMERAPDGAPLRMVGADTDITDLRRAEEARAALEEELRVARRMEALGTLAAGIAHDFNNCLMAILGYAGSAREHVSPASAAAECLDGVCKTAEDAAALTRSLLDFARNEPPAREPIEFVAFLRETLKRVRFTLPPGVELHADVPGDIRVWVAADATQLRQMLSNLVINACDAMPGGGRLTIAMRRLPAGESPTASAGDKPTAEDRIELCVSDTGEGMTAEVKARIFDPFFTTKQRGRGTGLGMAIVHRIVREHDGRIELDSTPGRGTRVTVTLPTCEPPEDPRPHGDEAEPVAESRAASTTRILLAEDNEHVRPILKMGLERAGYEVLEARDGREALAIIEARGAELSLLVLDVNLPHASGVECLQAARRDAPDMPAILMSGLTEQRDRTHRHDAVFLSKPFGVRELLTVVKNLLGESAALA